MEGWKGGWMNAWMGGWMESPGRAGSKGKMGLTVVDQVIGEDFSPKQLEKWFSLWLHINSTRGMFI